MLNIGPRIDIVAKWRELAAGDGGLANTFNFRVFFSLLSMTCASQKIPSQEVLC